MIFVFVQNKVLFIYCLFCSYPARQPLMFHVLQNNPPPPNHPSHQTNSIAVGVLPVLLSVLGTCEVGYIPVASATNPVSYSQSIVSACPLVLSVLVLPVSISASTTAVLLLSLPPVLIWVPTTATTILLPSEFSSLVSRTIVIYIADVFRNNCPWRGVRYLEQLLKQYPLKWNLMQIYLPYALFGNVWPSMFAGTKKYRNISITLRPGSTSGFLFSSLLLRWHDPPPPDPPPTELMLLCDFLLPLFFYAGSSTQAGGGGDLLTPFHPYL